MVTSESKDEKRSSHERNKTKSDGRVYKKKKSKPVSYVVDSSIPHL